MNRQLTTLRGAHRAGLTWLLLLVGLSLALASCGGGGAPTVVEATPTASVTATPTETSSPTRTPTQPPPAATPTTSGPGFAADVQPIFTERCIKCHSGEKPPRGLHLDSYEHIMAGSSYRPALIPGNPAESEIIKRIQGIAVPRMPFDGPPFLSDEEIEIIEAWIAAGAPNN